VPGTPTIYLLAGPNGAGKTTFAREFLPREVRCLRFMNADEVARGLSPFAPEAAGLRAGRVLIGEIREALASRDSFGWESTLSGRGHVRLLKQARAFEYEVELHYLSVSDVRICIERVAQRVREGGHNVPVADIKRRFDRSIENLIDVYLALANRWTIWDSTSTKPVAVLDSAQGGTPSLRSILLK